MNRSPNEFVRARSPEPGFGVNTNVPVGYLHAMVMWGIKRLVVRFCPRKQPKIWDFVVRLGHSDEKLSIGCPFWSPLANYGIRYIVGNLLLSPILFIYARRRLIGRHVYIHYELEIMHRNRHSCREIRPNSDQK